MQVTVKNEQGIEFTGTIRQTATFLGAAASSVSRTIRGLTKPSGKLRNITWISPKLPSKSALISKDSKENTAESL